ncbi:MAG: hypothetical protein DMG34_16120, partial [Acidobacteria bacterium]
VAKNSVKSRFLAILSTQEMREGQARAETTALPSRRNKRVVSSSPAEYKAVLLLGPSPPVVRWSRKPAKNFCIIRIASAETFNDRGPTEWPSKRA